MKLTVILQPEVEGGYSVVCPAVPGAISEGDNLPDALANITEATELILEVNRDEGLPGPIESPEIIAGEIERCLEDRAEEGLPLTIETREVEVGSGVHA